MIKGWSPWIDYHRVPPVVNLLFLDNGDHSICATMTDFFYWRPKVHKGGIIVFHDWRPNHNGSVEFAVKTILIEHKYLLKLDEGEGLIAFMVTEQWAGGTA